MPEPVVHSAQVVLAGAAPGERVQDAFLALGFTVGPCVGRSFSIAADAARFRAVFGVSLVTRGDGGVAVNGAPPAESGLPLHGLPGSLQRSVATVLFSEPPTFGPGAP